jgi:hypothetical protein
MSTDQVEYTLTVDDVAELAKVRVVTIRQALARYGRYYCLVPAKMPNGRLLFPADSKQRLLDYAKQMRQEKETA